MAKHEQPREPVSEDDAERQTNRDEARSSQERGAALRKERLDPAPLDASFEDVEELFAPDDDDAPASKEYGAQPPG
jgi:hypothetical protein